MSRKSLKWTLIASVGAAALAAQGTAVAAEPTVPHPFAVQISMSPKALAKLTKMGEKVKVLAYYSGPPIPSKKKLADDVGEISIGEPEEITLPADGGTAQLKGETSAKKTPWVSSAEVLINVVSARLKHQDNLLSCDLFQDKLTLAQQKPIALKCKLIEEG